MYDLTSINPEILMKMWLNKLSGFVHAIPYKINHVYSLQITNIYTIKTAWLNYSNDSFTKRIIYEFMKGQINTKFDNLSN